MSPASVRHVLFQAKIIAVLNQLYPDLIIVPKFPVETDEDVKVVDVGMLTANQAELLKNNVMSSFSPLLCVEVFSPSNTLAEMRQKRRCYFAAGAEEFWLCSQEGAIKFYNQHGEMSSSRLVANFPAAVDL
ncbi:Uma2 family endonuclease [Candidatus Electronema sp. JM]|uniref:Uma2 family endonuclease n=1 Tax=Candidatus Electronema sp. JM TaxID=3401571 RepID=UPI003AA924C3